MHIYPGIFHIEPRASLSHLGCWGFCLCFGATVSKEERLDTQTDRSPFFSAACCFDMDNE